MHAKYVTDVTENTMRKLILADFNPYLSSIFFTDYLKSANCIKNAAIEETGCKTFYDELLNEITSPSESATLCW